MVLFRASLACFSRIPVGHLPDEAFANAMRRLPSVGFVVALLVALVMFGGSFFWPAYIVALCGLVTWIAVTGAIHLDGVADSGDGLFMEGSLEKRLEVMKDPRLGAFGAITLMLMLAMKWAGLFGLVQDYIENSDRIQCYISFIYLASPIFLACILSRSLTFIFMHLPSARPNGMGNSMVDAVNTLDKCIAIALVMVAFSVLIWSHGLWSSFIMLMGGLIFATAIVCKAMKTLGGVTGDVYGFIIEGTECGVLLASAIII